MNKPLLSIYHHLPPSLRNLAASVHGLRLRRERYGEETDILVAGALERDQWSAARWRQWQEERLAFVLHRAATRVPYYREMWAGRRRQGDARPWDRLEHWPVLEKEELRRYGPSFVADDQSPREMTVERTSGTTGTPLTLWRSRRALRARFAHYEARRLRWNGVDRHDRWAILGGQLVTPFSRSRPPFWVWNRPLRQLYLSSYHLAPSFVAAYVEAMAAFRVRYLIGYPSSIDSIARAACPRGASGLKLKAVMTVAEPLYAHQREAIEAAFDCPVRETYGMAELAAAASECAEGRLHQWPEFGVCEISDADGDTARQGVGELIATSLLDVDMPLIRYRVGDRIAIGDESRLCPCGRALPLLDSVDGRCDDLLQTRDGRLVGRLDPVFKAGLGVREAQVIQESLDRIRVLLVPGEGFGAPDEVAIRRAVRDRLGDVRVSLECVAAIPRSRNGKFRAVISRVSPKPEVEEAPLKQAAATGLPMSKISVIVPCRNECGHIDRFLADLWSQQLPRGRELEVIVADGGSDDGSRDVLRRAAERRPNVTVIDNPRRIVSTGLNEAIRVSSGDVIIRMDVHTRYAPDYLAQSLAALSETGADCVGGPWVPLGVNHVSNAVALVFDSWFVSGGGRAHARAYDGPSDTVYLGAWRRDAFWSFGFFDESLVRSQDNELNFRIRRLGGIVWQSSRIRSLYQPRTTLSSLWRQYAQYGYWKVKVLQKHGRPATIRQLAPGLLVGLSIALLAASAVDATAGRALLFLLGSYALVSAAASLIACRRPRHWRYLPVTPAVFAAFHFGFGYGFLRGLVDFFLLRRGGRAGFSLLTRNRSKPPAKSAANTA